MKYLMVLVLVCAAVSFSEQAISKEQAKEMFTKMVEECAKKESGSQNDLEEILTKKMPSTKNGKCIQACLGETSGMMKDNKASIDGAIAVAKMFFDEDTAKIEMAKSIANDCVEVTDADRCEAAFKLMQCCEQAHKARGVSYEW